MTSNNNFLSLTVSVGQAFGNSSGGDAGLGSVLRSQSSEGFIGAGGPAS